MVTSSSCFVSVVAPLPDDASLVRPFVEAVVAVLKNGFDDYELVLVDDGGADEPVREVERLLKRLSCIRLLRLSRRFGTETAIAAGLDSAIGDFVVVMLAEDDPPAALPAMIQRCREGIDVVYGVRIDRQGQPLWTRAGAELFYWSARRLFGLEIPRNATHFRALSRRVVNAISKLRDSQRYIKLLGKDIGFSSEAIPYHVNRATPGHSKGFIESVHLAINIIVTNSINPLRFVTWLGLFASAVNVAYAGYVVAIYIFKDRVAEGWTTLSLQMSGMFFLLFLILSLLAEYVGRILFESRGQPLYHVLEEENSMVMVADETSRNVVLGP